MNLEPLKWTALINGLALLKLPLLAFCTPQVVETGGTKNVIRIRLGLRTRNHLGSMYFGALSMGAELSIALTAVTAIQASGKKIDFIFKDFSAEFLKRADGHVDFVCDEAADVRALIEKAAHSDERLEKKFNGYAIVRKNGAEPIMKYTLTLSVKKRSKKK